jgi:hypothetical protein
MSQPKLKPQGIQITAIPNSEVKHIWLTVYPMLEPAVIRSRGRWDMYSLMSRLLDGRQQLWLVFDENQILGAATTEIINYPMRKMLSVNYLGGKDLRKWADKILTVFESWARDNNCSGIEAAARAGFWKWMRNHDYDRAYTVFEKRIDHE